jgi:hypothetical protein
MSKKRASATVQDSINFTGKSKGVNIQCACICVKGRRRGALVLATALRLQGRHIRVIRLLFLLLPIVLLLFSNL